MCGLETRDEIAKAELHLDLFPDTTLETIDREGNAIADELANFGRQNP